MGGVTEMQKIEMVDNKSSNFNKVIGDDGQTEMNFAPNAFSK